MFKYEKDGTIWQMWPVSVIFKKKNFYQTILQKNVAWKQVLGPFVFIRN